MQNYITLFGLKSRPLQPNSSTGSRSWDRIGLSPRPMVVTPHRLQSSTESNIFVKTHTIQLKCTPTSLTKKELTPDRIVSNTQNLGSFSEEAGLFSEPQIKVCGLQGSSHSRDLRAGVAPVGPGVKHLADISVPMLTPDAPAVNHPPQAPPDSLTQCLPWVTEGAQVTLLCARVA